MIWRLLGVRIGRRVFDDGCSLTERTLVTHRRRLHAQRGQHRSSATRRRTAPSSPTTSRIGAGCTLGVGAFVHYGVTMGDGAVLAADSFLMKGEEVPPDARWGGNPARDLADVPDLPVPVTPRPAATDGDRAARPMGIFLLAAVPVVLLGLLFVAGLDRLVATAGEATLAAGVALHPGSAIDPVT